MKKISSPLRYPGGKSRALKYILPYCLQNFSEYREPFLGGGSVFLALKQIYPNKKYHISDLNYDLFCFWNQLKKNPIKLIYKISEIKKTQKNGKKLYNYFLNGEDFSEDFMKAVRFYVLNRITYSGTVDSGGYSQEAFEKRFTISRIEGLYDVAKLLHNVTITCENYTNPLYNDGTNVFLYLDPPYKNASKSRLYGNRGDLHSSFNHKEFINNVKKSPHYWLITLDDTNNIKNHFSSYYVYPWKMQYVMDNVNGNKPKKGSEIIITNYMKFKLIPINEKKLNLKNNVYEDIIKNFINSNSNISILNVPNKNIYYIKKKLLNTLQERGINDSINIEIIRKKIYLEKMIENHIK